MKKRWKIVFALVLVVGSLFELSASRGENSDPPPSMSQKRIQEFRDLRFGMFVCWSFSTFSNVEWTHGVKDVSWFNPTDFDPDQWCRAAKAAEMKYILFLTKHHDGFCLWDTATTDWKVTKSPLKIDALQKVRKACDRHGLKLAIYFSEGDWTWPGMKNSELKKKQLQELCTKYGPIEYFWLDYAQTDGGLDLADTVQWIKKFQPDCFVGSNGNRPGADLYIGEMGKGYALTDAANAQGYRAAEFTYPIFGGRELGRWFYTMPEWDNHAVPAETIYEDYLVAAKHVNLFALDVAPDRTGRLRDIDVRRLEDVGKLIRGEVKPPVKPLSQGKPARASSIWKSNPGFEATAAFDGNPETRWGAAENSRGGWLEVELGAEHKVARAVIDEGNWDRVRKFTLEYMDGGTWKLVASGTRIGPKKELKFPPIATQVFRLNILETIEVPTVQELQLFAE